MKDFLNKNLIPIGLALLLGLTPWIFWQFTNRGTHQVLIAAGQKSSQSYAVISAIAKVVQQDYSDIKIEVIETRGAKQNAELLERGLVQLATT